MITIWYERAKRILWPHVLVPLAAMVVIDYVALVGHIVQGLLAGYVLMQALVCGVGMFAGMMTRLNAKSHWATIGNYNGAALFPLIGIGFEAATWMLTEKGNHENVASRAEESASGTAIVAATAASIVSPGDAPRDGADPVASKHEGLDDQ